MRVLVVDDEAPARDDLAWLLRQEPSVTSVAVAGDATQALRTLQAHDIDVVFLDIRMPGLHGLDLARVLGRFANPPQVVFVTAHEGHAVEAFELRACDYLLKPVRAERLREALARVEPRAGRASRPGAGGPTGPGQPGGTTVAGGAAGGVGAAGGAAAGSGGGPGDGTAGGRQDTSTVRADDLPVLTVETAGRTRFVPRDDVRYAEASGDYTRLRTSDGSGHLVRIPLSTLEERWATAGFFRIHRSYLVSLQAVTELRASGGALVVVVEGRELPVSRRQSRALKDALIRSRSGTPPGTGRGSRR